MSNNTNSFWSYENQAKSINISKALQFLQYYYACIKVNDFSNVFQNRARRVEQPAPLQPRSGGIGKQLQLEELHVAHRGLHHATGIDPIYYRSKSRVCELNKAPMSPQPTLRACKTEQ